LAKQVSWKAKLALVFFGLGLGLICCEIALSLIYKNSGSSFENLDDLRASIDRPDHVVNDSGSLNLKAIINSDPRDEIIYDLKPNLDVVFQRARVRTNSCGMRDEEISLVKPANEVRIALLGDSFTFGWGVEQNESFGHKLEEILNSRSKYKHFKVLNFGIPGYSTFQETALFKEKALDFSPDAVLVFFVDNDFGLPFYVRDVNRPGNFLGALEFARLSWKAIDPQIESQRAQFLGWDPKRALAELSEICKKEGIEMKLAINPREKWKRDLSRLSVLRKHSNIQLIPMRQTFLEIVKREQIPSKDLSLSFDPHPSPLKHRILAQTLAPYFLHFDQ